MQRRGSRRIPCRSGSRRRCRCHIMAQRIAGVLPWGDYHTSCERRTLRPEGLPSVAIKEIRPQCLLPGSVPPARRSRHPGSPPQELRRLRAEPDVDHPGRPHGIEQDRLDQLLRRHDRLRRADVETWSLEALRLDEPELLAGRRPREADRALPSRRGVDAAQPRVDRAPPAPGDLHRAGVEVPRTPHRASSNAVPRPTGPAPTMITRSAAPPTAGLTADGRDRSRPSRRTPA